MILVFRETLSFFKCMAYQGSYKQVLFPSTWNARNNKSTKKEFLMCQDIENRLCHFFQATLYSIESNTHFSSLYEGCIGFMNCCTTKFCFWRLASSYLARWKQEWQNYKWKVTSLCIWNYMGKKILIHET